MSVARMHGVVSEMLKGLSSATGGDRPARGGSPGEVEGLPRPGELVSSGLKVGLETRWGGGGYPFVVCLNHLTIDHAFLSRRSTVPTPKRDTSNTRALITLLPYTT